MANKKTVITVKAFALLTSDQIVKIMKKDRNLRIEGETPGEDRKIIKLTKSKDHARKRN